MASVVRGVHLRSAKHEMKAFTNQRSILGSLNSLLFSNATSKVITKELQGPSTAIMRHLAVFVDPWSSADPEEDPPDEESVYQSNVPKAYSGVEGDLGKGMADDVRQHPFGGVLAGCVGHDEERGITYWEYDLTGGALYNNGQNALLSNETKNEMYRKHMSDPDKYGIDRSDWKCSGAMYPTEMCIEMIYRLQNLIVHNCFQHFGHLWASWSC